MKKELDIDKYLDGFDAQKIDCIHSPIAAAAGFFDKVNYFYYCYLYSYIKYFYVKKSAYNSSFFDSTNEILSVMNLSLKSVEYGEDYDLAISHIKKAISANNPVYIVCKYNTLFYNSYYGNEQFFPVHGILVSGFNDENKTFVINESTLLRAFLSKQDNTDVFFPLQIKSSALKEILMNSNLQFRNTKYEHENFESRIFYITKEKNDRISSTDIINYSLNLMKDSDFSNQLTCFLEANELNSSIRKEQLKNELFLNCVLGLIPVFRLLYMHVQGNEKLEEMISFLEKKLILNKQKTIASVIKSILKKEEIPQDKKISVVNSWKKDDLELLELLKTLSQINTKTEYEYNSINVMEYYNCCAFEESISDNSTADLTGEGTHYLFENIVTNSVWKNNDFQFVYSYAREQMDNISCEGQKIIIDNNFEASDIALLECAEFGSFQEKIIVNYTDGKSFEFIADFSDFFQAPVYNEKVFWSGVSLDRKKNKTIIHNFSARLFAKRYDIPNGIVSSIQLPDNRNVHIFAITLEKHI